MKKGSIGRTKKMTAAKATRITLEIYKRGRIFTMQDDITRTGLMYDVQKILGYCPSREAVKKAMQKLELTTCIDQWKSHYQKK